MFTVKSYKYLSEHAYWLDRGHEDYDPSLIEGKVIKEKDFHYKILKVEDNITNGMQAMAVAPFINGKVDTSEITIAYAGTNPGDNLDKWTDIQTVIVGSKLLDTSTLFKPADSLIEGIS